MRHIIDSDPTGNILYLAFNKHKRQRTHPLPHTYICMCALPIVIDAQNKVSAMMQGSRSQCRIEIKTFHGIGMQLCTENCADSVAMWNIDEMAHSPSIFLSSTKLYDCFKRAVRRRVQAVALNKQFQENKLWYSLWPAVKNIIKSIKQSGLIPPQTSLNSAVKHPLTTPALQRLCIKHKLLFPGYIIGACTPQKQLERNGYGTGTCNSVLHGRVPTCG